MTTSRRVSISLWAFAVLLFVAEISPGQTVPPKPDPVLQALDVRISSFLEGVSQGQTQNAYQDLLTGSQLAAQQEPLKELTEKTKQLQTKYGDYHGFEQIAAKRIGADLVLLRYLYKCRDFPVVWYFTFYRTPAADEAAAENGDWRVIAVRFDTNLEILGL